MPVPVDGFTTIKILTYGEEGLCLFCKKKDVWLECQVIYMGDTSATTDKKCSDCREQGVQTLLLEAPKPGVRPPSERMKKISQKQEKRIMGDIGGRTHKASGAAGDKGDGHLQGVVRVEAKYTFADSFRLGRDILDKIRDECRGKEVPSVIIDFKTKPSGRTVDSWAVIPYELWKKVIHGLREDR